MNEITTERFRELTQTRVRITIDATGIALMALTNGFNKISIAAIRYERDARIKAISNEEKKPIDTLDKENKIELQKLFSKTKWKRRIRTAKGEGRNSSWAIDKANSCHKRSHIAMAPM